MGEVTRRVYVRVCKKCGGAHWFEVEIPGEVERAFSQLRPCPIIRALVMVNYVPWR